MNEVMHIAGLDKFEFENIQGDDEGLLAEVMRELDRVYQCGTAKSSLQQANRYTDKLKEFLTAKGLCEAIEGCSEAKLNTYQ